MPVHIDKCIAFRVFFVSRFELLASYCAWLVLHLMLAAATGALLDVVCVLRLLRPRHPGAQLHTQLANAFRILPTCIVRGGGLATTARNNDVASLGPGMLLRLCFKHLSGTDRRCLVSISCTTCTASMRCCALLVVFVFTMGGKRVNACPIFG